MNVPNGIEDFANGTSRKQNQPASLTGEVSNWLVYTKKIAERISENTHARQLALPWSRYQNAWK
jgi:hypothetical protein